MIYELLFPLRHDAAWLRRTPDVFTLAFPTGWPNGTPTERTP